MRYKSFNSLYWVQTYCSKVTISRSQYIFQFPLLGSEARDRIKPIVQEILFQFPLLGSCSGQWGGIRLH